MESVHEIRIGDTVHHVSWLSYVAYKEVWNDMGSVKKLRVMTLMNSSKRENWRKY